MNANTLAFTWKCKDCNETCSWTYTDLADRGVPVCGKCGEDMELQPDSGEAPDLTELHLCEINRLILHADRPYIFRKAEGCAACAAYAEGRVTAARVVLLTDDGQTDVITVDTRDDLLEMARDAVETFHAAYPEVEADVQVVAVLGLNEGLCEGLCDGHVRGVDHLVTKAIYEEDLQCQ